MKDEVRICGNCKAWVESFPNSVVGTCRRHAPRPAIDSGVVFPEVLKSATACMEFIGKTTGPEEAEEGNWKRVVIEDDKGENNEDKKEKGSGKHGGRGKEQSKVS